MTDLRTIEREYAVVAIELVDDPELAARQEMDPDALEELARDIAQKGVLLPLIVFRDGDRYQVVAGHRRRRASLIAGLARVPCLIYPSRDSALEGVKYAENRFREKLNAADEALFFGELLERDCGGDVDRLCALVGEKRSYVEGRLLLFAGDQDVFAALSQDKIKIGVATELNKIRDPDLRRSHLRSAIVGGATVAMVQQWVNQIQAIEAVTPPSSAPAPSGDAPRPVSSDEAFRCRVCEKVENSHLIRHLPIHDYCFMAILKPLLDTYQGKDSAPSIGVEQGRT